VDSEGNVRFDLAKSALRQLEAARDVLRKIALAITATEKGTIVAAQERLEDVLSIFDGSAGDDVAKAAAEAVQEATP
jgi:hypothetical protein